MLDSVSDIPLVSVVCLCHNQAVYVEEAIMSVLNQTYPAVELVVVDDASSDGSQQIIKDLAERYSLKAALLEQNVGNCAAFNRGLALCSGKYVIDLAADDVLLPQRIQRQVAFFEALPTTFGVIFGNVQLIDTAGKPLRTFYSLDQHKQPIVAVPSGEVYAELVRRSFISAPSMMMRRQVLLELRGYDEQLTYEDFDFWIRASRNYLFGFQNEILTQKRILKDSLGRLYAKHLGSSWRVCQTIARLNLNEAENEALAERIRFFLRQCLFNEAFEEGELFLDLYERVSKPHWQVEVMRVGIRAKLRINGLYRQYRRLAEGWSALFN